jgi:hypothetical protein
MLAKTLRRVHAPAHVSRSQGRRVVDPVPHETDRVPARLKRVDDSLFVRRGDAGEQRRVLGRIGELLVGHLFDLRTQ